MRNDATGRMFLEVKQPLLEALNCLSSHASKIHTAWRKLLKRYEPCSKYIALLSGLRFTPQVQDLLSADERAYRGKSERQGQDLAQRGVPAECAAVAVALYVETCLPYLVPEESGKAHWTKAFTRWASVYQFYLLSGYSQQGEIERRSLEDKISHAARRSQEFSIHLSDAYEKDRRRLAQDLHDEIGHDLIVLKLYTELIALDLKKGDTSQLRGKLKESVNLIRHALKSVRHLTFDLGPAIWNQQGFVPAVKLYARQFARRTGIKVRLDAARLRANLPTGHETALYKVLQGALSNVVAHADAHRVRISLTSARDSMAMKIEDDGRGFNVERTLRAPHNSFGLRAMRERVELLGGAIDFRSRPVRRRAACHGTTIEIHLPLRDTEAT
jgi:signal transduction histidine kinase